MCRPAAPASPCAPWKRSSTRTTSPAEWADYTRANVDFFDELGSPGGASKVGKTGKDDPLVAALPPMGEEN